MDKGMLRMAIDAIMEKLHSKGVYVSVKLTEESKKPFNDYLKKNLPDYNHTPDPHLTLIYSKKEFNGEVATKDYIVEAKFKSFSVFGKEEKALVAELTSKELTDRNKELVDEYDFISDFDPYKPHITLAYDVGDFDVSTLPPINMTFKFDSETSSELNLDWNKDD